MRFKIFYIHYDKYVVFTIKDKQYTRRLYKQGNKYYIHFQNEKVYINEEQLYH